MQKTLHRLLLGAIALCAFACKAKVELNHIDTTAQLETQIGLPIGNISASIGDFLGDSSSSEYIRIYDGNGDYNHLMNEGTLFFRDTFHVTKNFHPIDLASRISEVTKELSVPAGTYPVAMMPLTLPDFPMTLHLNGFNNDTLNERVDSIYVSKASFVSTISLSGLSLQTSDIQNVEVLLPDEFIDRQGNPIGSLAVPFSDYGFGQEIPIELKDFTLCLMKDKTKKPSSSNVIDSLNFKIRITLYTGEDLTVGSNAAFNYNFKVKIIEFDAMWGFFEPSTEVSGKDSAQMDSLLSFWKCFERLHMPMAHPQIDIIAIHSIVAPLRTHVSYIYFEEANDPSKRIYANFNGKREYDWIMEYMPDGLSSPIDSRCIDAGNFKMNHMKEFGCLDQAFTIRPDKIGWELALTINNNYSDQKALEQFRITKNTDIHMSAITTFPFVFNEGVDVSYHDTIKDINISQYQLDSLLASNSWLEKVDTASLKLYIVAENWLPFDTDVKMRFLDKDENEIHFHYNVEEKEVDSLHIPGPTEYVKYGEYNHVSTPGKSSLIISVNRSEWDNLTRMTHIDMVTNLGKNTCLVSVLKDSKLKMKVGVAANVKAVVSLQNNNNK